MDWAKEEEKWKAFVEKYSIEIDSVHATVTLNGFEALDDYSHSLPSGVVIGKLWKRHELVRDAAKSNEGVGLSTGRGRWWLGQYVASDKPDMCKIIWCPIYVRHPGLPDEAQLATDDYLDSLKAEKALAV